MNKSNNIIKKDIYKCIEKGGVQNLVSVIIESKSFKRQFATANMNGVFGK